MPGVITGLLAFAFGPIQRLVDRFASAVVPRERGQSEYLSFRKLEVCRAALESAYEDGDVTGKERSVLERPREKRGVLGQDALALERDVRGRFASSEA